MHKPTEFATQLRRAAREAAVTMLGQRGLFRTLKGEHTELKTLLRRCGHTNTSARGLSIRRDVFATLRSELLAHALSEQQELYSVLEQHELTRSRAEIGERQHREIEALLQELSLLTATSPEWLARFRELEREVLRHIDEEEHQLFRLAERALTPERLHEIDRRFRIEKKRKLRELETTLH